jgi:uncharacterized protein (TIGR03032 family)
MTMTIQRMAITPPRPALTTELAITGSQQFTPWLAAQCLSLVFTTGQAGKVFWVGLNNGQLSLFERIVERCMGLGGQGNSLFLSTLYQLWRFENTLRPGQRYDGYDALYIPQMSYVTGDLDIRDIALDGRDRPIFVNTRFSCLATVSETHSFQPLWQPPFIDKLAAEDRCHLSGLAMREGKTGLCDSGEPE